MLIKSNAVIEVRKNATTFQSLLYMIISVNFMKKSPSVFPPSKIGKNNNCNVLPKGHLY